MSYPKLIEVALLDVFLSRYWIIECITPVEEKKITERTYNLTNPAIVYLSARNLNENSDWLR